MEQTISYKSLLDSAERKEELAGIVGGPLFWGDWTAENGIKWSMAPSLSVDGNSFNLRGVLEFEAYGSCSRCLEKTGGFSRLDFSERVLIVGAGCDELEEYFIIRDGSLDLKSFFWEIINGFLPMKILCSENCKGLCPVCGGDLNLKDCGCVKETVSPKWAALEELKKQMSEKS